MSNSSKNRMRRLKASTHMSTAELEAAAAIFDHEFAAEKFRRPTTSERNRWQKAKHKMGRPKIGQGAQVISVSVERGLLKQTDQLAKRLRVSRAKLIAHGLRRLVREQERRRA